MKRFWLLLLFWLAPLASAAQEQPAALILVAFHSETGHTQELAKAVREGAASVGGVKVWLRKVGDTTEDEILRADGILLGSPVHWAGPSAETKRFLDRVGNTLWKAKTTGEGRTAGVFCTGGAVASGKDLTRITLLAGFLQMRYIVLGGVDAEGFGTLGAQATTAANDPGLSGKELAEARRFGERFARLTRQIRLSVSR